MSAPDGLLVVDKPAGPTSHDVVAQVRRLANTRRVGHAGTLDPMATGVLVLGLGRATRLLGYLAAGEKSYAGRIRLGQRTSTDDAWGEVVAQSAGAAGLDEAAVRAAAATLRGELAQVPPAFSAVQVGGRRAYARARAGEHVELAPRTVVVHRFEVLRVQPVGELLDVDVEVDCSAGTYIRALARDLGAALGVGGHLSSLRRTRAGRFDVAQAASLPIPDGAALPLLPLAAAVAACFPRRDVDAAQARLVAHGGALPGRGEPGPVGVFGPAGEVLALTEERDGAARPLVVFVG